MNEEENWKREYPEGSLGWKINNKIDAVVEHAVKSGRILMFLFVVLFTPAVIESAAYPHGPFFAWRFAFDGVNLAQWNNGYLRCCVVDACRRVLLLRCVA